MYAPGSVPSSKFGSFVAAESQGTSQDSARLPACQRGIGYPKSARAKRPEKGSLAGPSVSQTQSALERAPESSRGQVDSSSISLFSTRTFNIKPRIYQ
jgi:hypothetical protein